jgi:hypothetical protein
MSSPVLGSKEQSWIRLLTVVSRLFSVRLGARDARWNRGNSRNVVIGPLRARNRKLSTKWRQSVEPTEKYPKRSLLRDDLSDYLVCFLLSDSTLFSSTFYGLRLHQPI